MSVYIRKYEYSMGAGNWIYKGYASAYQALGEEVVYYNEFPYGKLKGNKIMIMDLDLCYDFDSKLETLKEAEKVFLFASPNWFPEPWGSHPNYVNSVSKNIEYVNRINECENFTLWNFSSLDKEEQKKYFPYWKRLRQIPLAFDQHSYKRIEDPNWKYDVAYCGGWADNGHNSKAERMKEVFKVFKETELKCGFFVNKNLTHEQECKLLMNSKICINIHDTYQTCLGLDTNERTFKSLGMNGTLVSDDINQIRKLFEPIYFNGIICAKSVKDMVEAVQEYLSIDHETLENYKEKNRQNILEKHTYDNRIEMLENFQWKRF